MKKLLNKLSALLESRPLITIAIMAVAVNLIIELLGHKNPLKAFSYIISSPHMFLLNAAIIFMTLIFALLLCRRVFYTLFVSFIWLIFGGINWATLSFRTTPFSARDFSVLASGFQIADVYFTPLEFVCILAGFITFVALSVLLFIKAPKCERKMPFNKSLVAVLSFAAAMFLVGFFGTKHIKLSAEYESINAAYEHRGFAYCFMSSIFKSGISRPENYSKDAIDKLSPDASVDAKATPNIIVLQLESFFDPALIKGVELETDPIPNFTRLRDNNPSGYLSVPTLGAGTVNAEFEVLTGMNLDYFGIGEYPFESVLREYPCESIAYDLKNLGYKCHAIHNYTGSFYGRNEVYPNLGFDDFTSIEYMQNVEYTEKGWAKDAVLTDYVMEALESTEETDFVHTVSVQGHGKYPSDSDDITVSFKDNEVFTGADAEIFKYFVTQLSGTDAFLGELIERLEDFDEDVIVVAYGDHLPTLGIAEENLINGTLFQTQYFIWSNYGLDGGDIDLKAYQLTSHVLEMAGIDGGVMSTYHRQHMGLEGYQEGLETLEYDILYGDKLAYGGKLPFERADMKMGLNDIVITEKLFESDRLTIRGDGFTEYSVVYINGKRNEETVFVSESEIYIPNPMSVIGEDALVEVCQTGPDRKILSTAADLTK